MYPKSRRGGLDRAALARRRMGIRNEASQAGSTRPLEPAPATHQPLRCEARWDQIPISPESSIDGSTSSQGVLPLSEFEGTSTEGQYLELYYMFFHGAHPCVLPYRYLERRFEISPEVTKPLMLVLQYTGSMYSGPGESASMLQEVRSALLAATGARNPYLVQALLIFSIVRYWCDEIVEGQKFLENAMQMAVELGMHLKNFATDFGEDDRVLEETWRRTWWFLYCTDFNHAASSRSPLVIPQRLVITTDLPCEESEFESGVCDLFSITRTLANSMLERASTEVP